MATLSSSLHSTFHHHSPWQRPAKAVKMKPRPQNPRYALPLPVHPPWKHLRPHATTFAPNSPCLPPPLLCPNYLRALHACPRCRQPPTRQHPAVCGCRMHVLTPFGLSAMHEKRRQLLLRQALSASHVHTSAHHRTPLLHTSFPPSLPSRLSLLPFLHVLPSFPTPYLPSIAFPCLPSFRPSMSCHPSAFVPQYPYILRPTLLTSFPPSLP